MVTGTYYAYPFPVYQPAMRLIAAITNSFPATVTTTFDHQYITGTIVRIDIPFADGMQELNQQTAPITVTGATTFTIPIDTTNFNAFSIPSVPPYINTAAQVVPVGEISSTLDAATVNVL
jgi:Ubiquitin-activating enzyme E1 FCCH domain